MSKKDVKERIDKLKKAIDKYRYNRLVLDTPIIDEQSEDTLKKELFDLEQDYPELVTSDSPTQRVAGKPLDKFEKFTHPYRMHSFNDAFDQNDMEDWVTRLERLDSRAVKKGYYVEPKLDGLAMELVYRDGILAVGATRGDGFIGENVTQNLKTIESIPLRLNNVKGVKMQKEIVVRGEVFINKKDFHKINKLQASENKPIYANPRNLAAGSVRQLDPNLTRQRHLDAFAYALKTNMGQRTHEDEHDLLKQLGFKTNEHTKYCKNLDEVKQYRDYWEEHRETLSYEIDGIVVQINDNAMFDKLGVVGKAPRGAVAYKFSPAEATTILENIIISVGRTGVLTPVAVLRSVEIGGTIVSRATLHNEDEIERLKIKIGDTVIVHRAGDVIPDVKGAIIELRPKNAKTFKFPNKCPQCERPVTRQEGESAYRCINKDCPARRREGMYHFVSRGALDVDGLGPKIIDQLMDAGLVKDPADLFRLQKEDLLNLERFAEKSADNTIQAIKDRKKMPLDRFIFAIGIPHVGTETARDLAQKYGSLDAVEKASIQDLEAIEDIGAVVAKSICYWFKDSKNQALLRKLNEAGVIIEKVQKLQISNKLKGLTFVFTGSFETITRQDAQTLVRKHGGNASSTVSAKTDYVVAGDEAGSKLDKANKLGIKVITEKEFLKMV